MHSCRTILQAPHGSSPQWSGQEESRTACVGTDAAACPERSRGPPQHFFRIDFDKISVLYKLRSFAGHCCPQILAYKRLARKIFWNKELDDSLRRGREPFTARADSISRAFGRTVPVFHWRILRVKVVRHSGRDKCCGKARFEKRKDRGCHSEPTRGGGEEPAGRKGCGI